MARDGKKPNMKAPQSIIDGHFKLTLIDLAPVIYHEMFIHEREVIYFAIYLFEARLRGYC